MYFLGKNDLSLHALAQWSKSENFTLIQYCYLIYNLYANFINYCINIFYRYRFSPVHNPSRSTVSLFLKIQFDFNPFAILKPEQDGCHFPKWQKTKLIGLFAFLKYSFICYLPTCYQGLHTLKRPQINFSSLLFQPTFPPVMTEFAYRTLQLVPKWWVSPYLLLK